MWHWSFLHIFTNQCTSKSYKQALLTENICKCPRVKCNGWWFHPTYLTQVKTSKQFRTILLEIHSFIDFPSAFPGRRCVSNRLRRSVQTSLSPATDSSSYWGMPRRFQANCEILSFKQVLGLPQSLRPVGCAWNSSTKSWQGGIFVRCPNHRNCLLSIWRHISSSPRLSQIVK